MFFYFGGLNFFKGGGGNLILVEVNLKWGDEMKKMLGGALGTLKFVWGGGG